MHRVLVVVVEIKNTAIFHALMEFQGLDTCSFEKKNSRPKIKSEISVMCYHVQVEILQPKSNEN